jgi:hypothetical protein
MPHLAGAQVAMNRRGAPGSKPGLHLLHNRLSQHYRRNFTEPEGTHVAAEDLTHVDETPSFDG